MQIQSFLILIFFLFICGCSGDSIEAENKIPESVQKAIAESHDQISKDSILADFVKEVSTSNYDNALLLIHPDFKEAWTAEQFVKDWKYIREQLTTEWAPEITGTFSGNSPQGPYQQATYRLSSNWRSASSVELVSVKKDKQDFIVRVHARVPYKKNPPKVMTDTVDQLIYLIRSEKYQETESLMTANCKKQFPPDVIKKLAPILGAKNTQIEKSHYRFLANTIWYDAVRLNQAGDSFTYLEFILTSDNEKSQLASLTFRGSIQ